MPRISRETFESGFFHIMVQGINKEYIFKEKENKEKYLYLMKKYYSKYKIKIISYCIMNNHTHFIIYTNDVTQISAYMHKINSIYAMDYNKSLQRVGYVFRDRYKSQYIYDKEYLHKCIKYIHMNPVKAKMVDSENKYKYSSYNDFKYKQNFIDDEVIKLVFDNINYEELFEKIEDTDIEIMDVDRDDENFDIAIKKYLREKNINIEQVKNSKQYLCDFVSNLINKGYKQKQIAEKLEVSTATICLIAKSKDNLM